MRALPRTPSASQKPTDERPGTFNSKSFDKHLSAAFEKAEQNDKPTDAEIGGHIQPKGLDAGLKASFERAEALETERAEFNAAAMRARAE